MGPMATIDLFNKIVNNTTATTDQEHLHLIIDNNTEIPDRSAYIVGEGINPLDEIYTSAKRLILSGANALAISCNTAHYFYDDLIEQINNNFDNITFINMIEETVKRLSISNHNKVFLLATQGTYNSGIYDHWCDLYNIELIIPNQQNREYIMNSIYDYKSSGTNYLTNIESVLHEATDKGVSAIILGCTELPLIFENIESNYKIIDPSMILAETIIEYSKSLSTNNK